MSHESINLQCKYKYYMGQTLRNYSLLIWDSNLTRLPSFFLETQILHLPLACLWNCATWSLDWGGAVYYIPGFLYPHVGPLWSERTEGWAGVQWAWSKLTQRRCLVKLALWGGSEGETYWPYSSSASKRKSKVAVLILILHIYFLILRKQPHQIISNHWYK